MGNRPTRIAIDSLSLAAVPAGRASLALTVVGAIVAAAVLVLWPGMPAGAAISGVSPAQGGTLEPGDSTQFSVTTNATCLRANGDSPNYMVFLDVAGLCGLPGDRTATVSVLTTLLTPPGTYSVTVVELGPGASDSYTWTFAVAGPDDNTTTTAPTTTTSTTVPVTTTTQPPGSSTTTTGNLTTTTSLGPGADPDDAGTPGSSDDPSTAPTTAEVGDEEPATTTTTAAPGATLPTDDQDEDEAPTVQDRSAGLAAPQAVTSPPGLSGLGWDGFLSLFEQGSQASLEGLSPGYFDAFFGDDGAGESGGSTIPRLPWLLVLTGFTPVLLTAMVYLRRPGRR